MSFYDASVPALLQILGSLSGLLTKAEAHCAAKNIQPEVLLSARLYPDMLPLSKQIQLACDFSGKGCARLAHVDVPSTPDTEKTFEELRQRLAKTSEYLKKFTPAQLCVTGRDALDDALYGKWVEVRCVFFAVSFPKQQLFIKLG